MTPLTMPHPLTISVWLVTQTLILLLGQCVQPWSQHPSFPYTSAAENLFVSRPILHQQASTFHPVPPKSPPLPFCRSSAVEILTQVLSPSNIICCRNHIQVISPSTKNCNLILKYWLSTLFYLLKKCIVLALCQELRLLQILTHLIFLTALWSK